MQLIVTDCPVVTEVGEADPLKDVGVHGGAETVTVTVRVTEVPPEFVAVNV